MSKKLINGKKKASKKIIIPIIVVVVLLLGGIGGFFGYKYYKDNQGLDTEWADTYYTFIKESKEKNTEKKVKDNSKITFIQVPEVEEPVMIVKYVEEEKKYTDIYYINEEKVENVISLEPNEVKMLYNIENKTYNWYIHNTTETEEKYSLVSNSILELTDEEKAKNEYTYKINEEIKQETVDGNTLSIKKFDTEFVEPDIKIEEIDYKEDLNDKELKENLNDGTKEYKTNDKITDKKVQEQVEKKVTEVNTKQEEMTKAQEAVKQKEEEERKRAEEEAKKGFKVGSYTLKYGTYKSNLEGDVVGNNGKYTINQNGTYTYTKDKDREYNQSTKQYFETSVQESGTYEAKMASNDGVPVLSICFNPTSSNIKQYLYYGNGISEECFEVKSNNSWHGVQYLNDYTYIG